jgi:hypothetical protein
MKQPLLSLAPALLGFASLIVVACSANAEAPDASSARDSLLIGAPEMAGATELAACTVRMSRDWGGGVQLSKPTCTPPQESTYTGGCELSVPVTNQVGTASSRPEGFLSGTEGSDAWSKVQAINKTLSFYLDQKLVLVLTAKERTGLVDDPDPNTDTQTHTYACSTGCSGTAHTALASATVVSGYNEGGQYSPESTAMKRVCQTYVSGLSGTDRNCQLSTLTWWASMGDLTAKWTKIDPAVLYTNDQLDVSYINNVYFTGLSDEANRVVYQETRVTWRIAKADMTAACAARATSTSAADKATACGLTTTFPLGLSMYACEDPGTGTPPIDSSATVVATTINSTSAL